MNNIIRCMRCNKYINKLFNMTWSALLNNNEICKNCRKKNYIFFYKIQGAL